MRCLRLLVFFAAGLLAAPSAHTQTQPGAHAPAASALLPPSPPSFIDGGLRHGEGSAGALATAAWPGVKLLVRERGWSLVFTDIARDTALRPHSGDHGPWCGVAPDISVLRSWRVDVDFAGARAGAFTAAVPTAAAFSANTVIAAAGRNASGGCATSFSAGSRIHVPALYPGVDLELVCEAAAIRCIWHVQPGSTVREIPMLLRGCSGMTPEADGCTVMTPLGEIRFPGVAAFTGTDARLAAGRGNGTDTLRLLLPTDAARSGAVVAQQIEWSTFFGGVKEEFGNSTAIDGGGNVLVAGWTAGSDIPATAGVMQTASGGGVDAFAAKYSSAGALLWMTYLGGAGTDMAMSVTADAAGNVLVCGYTASADFPVSPGAFQGTIGGGQDGFLTVLSDAGALRWSTFMGGSLDDECHDVTVDSRRNVILLTGRSFSADFPVSFGAFQFMRAGDFDAILTAFRFDGTQLWGTYLGGAAEDWGHSVQTDASSNVLVCGHTHSSNFPRTPDAAQPLWNGDRDGFVAVFSSAGARKYVSYIGGNDWDDAYGIASDDAKNIVLAGGTSSANFPVTGGAFQTVYASAVDAFAMRLDSAGRPLWATYCGSAGKDIATSVAAFPGGNLVCTGSTASAAFPVTAGAVQPVSGGGTDAFLLKLRHDGSMKWSTYLGGSGEENPEDKRGLACVATSRFGEITCTGWTASADFPVTAGASQGTLAGSWDAFVVKFDCPLVPPVAIGADGPISFCEGGSVRLGAAPGYASYLWSTGETSDTIFVAQSGSYWVAVTDSNDCGGASNAITVAVHPLPAPVITPLGPTEFCDGESVDLDAGAGYASCRWSTGDTTRVITVRAGATCSVLVLDNNGCEGTSPPVVVTVHPRPSASIAVNGPIVFCDGGSTQLDAGAGYASYRWSTGDTARSITVTRSGLFTVIVTNLFGCADTADAVQITVHPLPLPVFAVIGSPVFCAGDSVVFLVENEQLYRSVVWSNGDTARRITVRAPGVYTVTVTDFNSCSAVSAPTTVTVHPLPAPFITPLGPTVFCAGDSVVLDAGGGYASYVWSNSSSTRTITVSSSGLFRVHTTLGTGCSAWSDTLRVTVHPNPAPVILPGGPLAFCDGDSVVLSAPAGYASYRWSTGALTRAVTVRQGGTFDVEVTDGNGCRGTSPSVTVTVYPLPAVPAISQDRDTLFSTPEYRYHWNLNGAPLPADTGRVLLIPRSGTYTVTVFNREGCSATSPPLSLTIALSTVALPVIEAAPGERITIPLRMTASENLTLAGARRFRSAVRFDRRLLVPVDTATGWSIQGDNRVFSTAGQWIDSVGTLFSFDCVAMLGPVDSAVLSIDHFAWTSGAVRVTTIPGLFRLRICREGGARLFDGSVRAHLAQNQPNPFNTMTRIAFQIMEPGHAALRVHDAYGRLVAVLRDGWCEPGSYTALFDASTLASGVYVYSLQTATRLDQRMMTVLK